jgi:HEAT repeat protein
MDEDRIARRGAARLFVRAPEIRTRLHSFKPFDVMCYTTVLDVLQEARSPTLRQLAVTLIAGWSDLLPSEEVKDRLLSLVADPHEHVRRHAILVAGQMKVPSALLVLLDLVDGKEVSIRPLPPVPEYEEYVPYDYPDEIAKELSLADLAAYALGDRKTCLYVGTSSKGF